MRKQRASKMEAHSDSSPFDLAALGLDHVCARGEILGLPVLVRPLKALVQHVCRCMKASDAVSVNAQHDLLPAHSKPSYTMSVGVLLARDAVIANIYDHKILLA